MHEITDLLKAWSSGDAQALEKLVPLVDDELRKIAHHYMRNERSGHILQTTALVNEALIKLIRENISWENRNSSMHSWQSVCDRFLLTTREEHSGLISLT